VVAGRRNVRAICSAWSVALGVSLVAGSGELLGISDLPGLDGGGAALDSTTGGETAPDGEPLAMDSGSASGSGDAATNASEAGLVSEASTGSSSGGSSSGGVTSSSSGSGGSTGSSSSGSSGSSSSATSASSSSGSTGSSSGSGSSSGGVGSSGGSGSSGASSGSGSSSGSGVTSCCTGLSAGTECCQYSEASCVDAGQTWENTGTGCSPANTNGAVTDPSCCRGSGSGRRADTSFGPG
jgi:hypothetical protein